MRWIKKWLALFMMGTTSSRPTAMQSLGRSNNAHRLQVRKLGVCQIITIFYLSRSEAGALFVISGDIVRRGIVLHGCRLLADFNEVFRIFFRRDSSFRCVIQFSFSSLGGATIFAKLLSKITKSPKIGGKVCAHH